MKTLKKPKPKGRRNQTITFEGPPLHLEFTDNPTRPPLVSVDRTVSKNTNGSAAGKKRHSVLERSHLRDVEIWLNNCVNLAERLEGKQEAKLVQLLRDARALAIKLRG